MPNSNKTWPKFPTHEQAISTKFEENRTKTVDFYYWSIFDPVANSLEQSLDRGVDVVQNLEVVTQALLNFQKKI